MVTSASKLESPLTIIYSKKNQRDYSLNIQHHQVKNNMPSPIIKKEPQLMDFSTAIRKVTDGKRITKAEWGDYSIYGELRDGILILHKEDKDFQWVLSDGDILGIDWLVI